MALLPLHADAVESPVRPGMEAAMRGLLIVSLLCAAVSAEAQQADPSPGGYSAKPDTAPAIKAPAVPAASPALRLPGADWNGAAAAVGQGNAETDLAGDPSDRPLTKPKLAAADQDSFFNSQEWQNINTPKGGHGHSGALHQLAGAGEGMSLNLAVDGLTKLVEGH
jgi:hypothetical protein